MTRETEIQARRHAVRNIQFTGCWTANGRLNDFINNARDDVDYLLARCAGLERERDAWKSDLRACLKMKDGLISERGALQAKLEEIEARADDEAVFGDHNLIPHYEAKLAAAVSTLGELHMLVWGECPSLLDEDSGGSSRLDLEIRAALADATTDEVQP